jgi:dihydropteroate synthase
MGVVNVTPDSFSDGGLFLDPERAIEHGRELIAEGADVLDVGGESTRPGAPEVPEDEERRRVLPVIEGLAGEGTPISIDTSKLTVAEAALAAGALIVNDVTALRAAPEIAALCADRGAELVLMHMQGDPRTMQLEPAYDDVVSDVKRFLEGRLAFAVSEGIREELICVDPGIGFGKTAEHNLALLHDLSALRDLGRPILLGTSRKSTLGRILDLPPDQRLEATLATTALGIAAGVDIVRVHDVRPNVRAARMADAIVRNAARLRLSEAAP